MAKEIDLRTLPVSEWVGQLFHLQPRLVRLAFRVIHHQEMAEDIVQATLANLLSNSTPLAGSGRATCFITKAVLHESISAYRQQAGRRARWGVYSWETHQENMGEPADTDAANDVHLLAEHSFLKEAVAQALRLVPEHFRLPVHLYDIENWSYEEIAQILDCPIGTVRSRISRGRVHLRPHLLPLLQTMS